MAQESPDHTLQPTALVHEAYLRLVSGQATRQWDNRRHFFAAAGEAMRRILVESARRKKQLKQGGDLRREPLVDLAVPASLDPDLMLTISDAIDRLGLEDPQAAELVKLRYFVGFSLEDAADSIGIARSTAYKYWAYAKAWLQCEIDPREGNV
jgi:RNA polymerase sigma factor (TIGR02999 family)